MNQIRLANFSHGWWEQTSGLALEEIDVLFGKEERASSNEEPKAMTHVVEEE